jgi:hypothetical protein
MHDFFTLFVVALSFGVTFLVARVLSRGFRKRRADKAQQDELRTQTRQVRRARERKGRG